MSARVFIAALLACALNQSAQAHRLKESLTTVELNARTQMVEVIHRFYVHDAEHAIRQLGGLAGDIHSDENLRRAFARYVAQRFVLAGPNREQKHLTLIGVEIDGGFVWIYEEMPEAEFADISFVSHSSMQDVWSDQVNQVNFVSPSGTRSIYLQIGTGLVPVPPTAAGANAPATAPAVARDETTSPD